MSAGDGGPRAHRPGALFWRVYLHGLLLLLVVLAAVGGVAWALRRESGWHRPERAAAYAAERVAELRADPARLGAELDRVRELFGVEATVYDAAGALVASSAAPPLPAAAAPAEERGGPVRLAGRGLAYAVALPGEGGHVVFDGAGRERDPRRPLLFLAAVLGALALASFPLARSIAAPVERLTRAARALGAGDLSARAGVRARGEVGELGRAFDEMAERLERLVRSEQELMANVSHELRTPLARIRVALELAAEGDLERARRFLGEIGADLAELDRLVEEVLAAARLEGAARGELPLRRAEVDLAEVIAEAAARFRAARPGRTLEVEVAPGLPPVRADAALLRRLLVNLLDNAGKYSDAPAPVSLAARAGEGEVVLEVADRGIGIEPGDLPRLFTPFFRTDRSRARGTGGVGLGLALARRIARAHGGEVTARSRPGEGSVFRVTLPAG